MSNGQEITQSAISGSPSASLSVANDASNDNQSPVKRRRSMSVQSLMSRAPFVSFDEEGGGEILSQEVGALRERAEQMAMQNENFQRDAVILVKQVGESLGMLDGARLKNELTANTQKQQMEALLNQTQGIISQRQATNKEMRDQQWVLNSEFVKLGEWKTRVENELLATKGNQEVLGHHLNHVHEESQSSMGVMRNESQQNLGVIKQELKDMKKA